MEKAKKQSNLHCGIPKKQSNGLPGESLKMGSESNAKKRMSIANLLQKQLDFQHPYTILLSGCPSFTSLQETGRVIAGEDKTEGSLN